MTITQNKSNCDSKSNKEEAVKIKRLIATKPFKTFIICLVSGTVICLLPDLAFADSAKADAFSTVLDKMTGWVGGSAGKLITFSSLMMAGVMGVLSFPARYIIGALGTGLLLSTSKTLVEMIF